MERNYVNKVHKFLEGHKYLRNPPLFLTFSNFKKSRWSSKTFIDFSQKLNYSEQPEISNVDILLGWNTYNDQNKPFDFTSYCILLAQYKALERSPSIFPLSQIFMVFKHCT